NGVVKELCNKTDLLCGAGATTTLQDVYDAGNTLTTTNARNLSVTLANTATDANFVVNVATGSTSQLKVQDNSTDVLAIGSSGQLALSVQGSTGGLLLGGDANLYRGAANILQTDDGLYLRGGTNAFAMFANTTDANALFYIAASNGALNWGAGGATATDTALYRSAANTLTTDDIFNLAASTTTGGYISQSGSSLIHTFGTSDFFAGAAAGNFTLTGSGQNTGVGMNTLQDTTNANDNSAFGYNALANVTSGGYNVGVGSSALLGTLGGFSNTAVGTDALKGNTSGDSNVAIGNLAGYTGAAGNANTIGDKNTFLGYSSGPGVVSATNLQNATAVGAYSVVNQDNSIVLGCTSGTNSCPASTRVGIGTTTPSAVLHVSSGGTDPLFRVTDTTATAQDVFSIADGGATTFRNQTNSTTAFQVQNAAGQNYIFVNTSGAVVALGDTSIASSIQVGNTTGAVAQSINIGNNTIAGSTNTVQIGSTIGTSSVTIQGGTGTSVNIGTGGIANTLQIGNTTGAVAQTINIGNNATASSVGTVLVGSSVGASLTTVQAGTGGLVLKAIASNATAMTFQDSGGVKYAVFDTQNTRLYVGDP
ncbi:MAG TPA: hypothetical protein VMR98_05265, partial [Candidatus Polarisedimenticolaceae bacterium]|nr:hypothetical protein [Candidatus Polarisedimenticolaceae bacterium]